MKIIAFLLIFISMPALSLEVDEKLTVRILKTSETRKTLMINRGTEDGLVEGDHAKFIVTAGIVARAVSIKVSPTRSIWSVYRLVNADFIVNDSVMSIKITPPVKITKDVSQTLVQEDTPKTVSSGDGLPLGVPLADGAQDLGASFEDGGDDMRALEDSGPVSISQRNIEVYSFLNISGLSANSKTEVGNGGMTNSQASHHIGLGAEYYPQRERSWYSSFSLHGAVNLMHLSNQAHNGSSSVNDVMEFSGGVNWHPTKRPSQVMAFIPYFSLAASMGTAKSTYAPGLENPGGDNVTANGSTMGFSAGFGYKFYTAKGFGARILADYYFRTESYKEDNALNTHNKVVTGPRLMLGLSYRF